MNDNAEASEKQHVVNRGVAVSLRVPVQTVEYVEAKGERQVGGHRESVGHGKSGEDAVGGGDHVGSRQDDDVECVGDDAEDTDDAGQVAVIALVPVVQSKQLVGGGVRKRRRFFDQRHRRSFVQWRHLTAAAHSCFSNRTLQHHIINKTPYRGMQYNA